MMSIRIKIICYFIATTVSLMILSSFMVYVLFAQFRKEEFRARQEQKIKISIGFLLDFKEQSENISDFLDKSSIHDFYDEKMMIFDADKQLVFNSIDDLTIHSYQNIINRLSIQNPVVEIEQGKYNVMGRYIEWTNGAYYAINKSYDKYGYSKLNFIRNLLLSVNAIALLIALLTSKYLAEQISKPIDQFAEKINGIDFGAKTIAEISLATGTHELNNLVNKFNSLVARTNHAFVFEKQLLQHMSHQLKTPLAILLSGLERLKHSVPHHDGQIDELVEKSKNLGDIVQTLLQLSKIETGIDPNKEEIRIDELIFEIIEEISSLRGTVVFEFSYYPTNFSENRLIVSCNRVLLRQAFVNLLQNAAHYSSDNRANIQLDCSRMDEVVVEITNPGPTVDKSEVQHLFHHFFRGTNSLGKSGFGLGLVLVARILDIYGGNINYSTPNTNTNLFTVHLPLS